MKKNISFLFLTLFIITGCNSGRKQQSQSYKENEESQIFRIAFYNTENLYDIDDDPETNDQEFTPTGSRNWDYYKYNDKMQKVAKVLIAVGGWQGCDLIGLCEIENRKVLGDLIKLTPMKSLDYGIIHRESKDPRGSDVALLYRKSTFQPIFYDFFMITFENDSASRTRDILYAKGIVKGLDTLHIIVNHWPSRRGGKEQSEPRRIQAGEFLRMKVDSILKINKDSKIVMMGDLNDEPLDRSLVEALGAQGDSTKVSGTVLYNFMYHFDKKGLGSYKYQYEWNMLDQIIGSPALFNGNKLFCNYSAAHIFQADWLMEDDPKFPGKKPMRTFSGPRYIGGYSDHLPVYLDLSFEK
jgi:predicted extracellular nuclease